MNENDEFTHVQRRLCAVIAKSEWTSSRMRMQKSGEELRESRAKSNRTANQFLQDLLGKRTDSDLIDDNGAVDRYHKFLKYKSGSNEDSNSTLDEFNRRLRALNVNRENQLKKVNNTTLHTMNEKNQQENHHHLHHRQSPVTIDVQNDKKEIVLQSKPSRILPTVTPVPITSTPNDTTNEISSSVFQDDDIRELSKVHSTSISSIDSQANHIESSIDEEDPNCLEKVEPLNSSTPSLTQALCASTPHRYDGTEIVRSPPSSAQDIHAPTPRRSAGTEVVRSPHSSAQALHPPTPHRYDGTEIVRSPPSLVQNLHAPTPRRSDSAEIVRSPPSLTEAFHAPKARRPGSTEVVRSPPSLAQDLHAPIPRRSDGTEILRSPSSKLPLTKGPPNVLLFNHCHFPRALTSHGKAQTSSISKRQLPSLPSVQKSEEKQYSTEEVYDLLDQLDNHSSTHFTDKLNRLTLSTVIQQHHEMINGTINQEDLSEVEEEGDDYDNEEKENIFPNLFEPSSSTTEQEKLFYSTLDVGMDDANNLLLYTMTLGTVQLSASMLLPYSILNGRRPSLKCSERTNFKRIRSKQPKHTCQVTAIESCSTSKQLQPNDIILRIDDQSVWNIPTESIIERLKEVPRCSLTIARLCQPFN